MGFFVIVLWISSCEWCKVQTCVFWKQFDGLLVDTVHFIRCFHANLMFSRFFIDIDRSMDVELGEGRNRFVQWGTCGGGTKGRRGGKKGRRKGSTITKGSGGG